MKSKSTDIKIDALIENDHVLILTNRGEVYSFGSNDVDQLGYPTLEEVTTKPKKIPGLPPIKAISSTSACSIALSTDGEVFTWGDKLETGRKDKNRLPEKVPLPDPVIQVAAGRYHMMALTQNGEVFGWGTNRVHQIDYYSTDLIKEPKKLLMDKYKNPLFKKVTKIACSNYDTLALDVEGNITQWGRSNNLPSWFSFPIKFIKIECGGDHFLALNESGRVFKWNAAYMSSGEEKSGLSDYSKSHFPTEIKNLPEAKAIKGSQDYSLVFTTKCIYSISQPLGFPQEKFIFKVKANPEFTKLIHSESHFILPVNPEALIRSFLSKEIAL